MINIPFIFVDFRMGLWNIYKYLLRFSKGVHTILIWLCMKSKKQQIHNTSCFINKRSYYKYLPYVIIIRTEFYSQVNPMMFPLYFPFYPYLSKENPTCLQNQVNTEAWSQGPQKHLLQLSQTHCKTANKTTSKLQSWRMPPISIAFVILQLLNWALGRRCS